MLASAYSHVNVPKIQRVIRRHGAPQLAVFGTPNKLSDFFEDCKSLVLVILESFIHAPPALTTDFGDDDPSTTRFWGMRKNSCHKAENIMEGSSMQILGRQGPTPKNLVLRISPGLARAATDPWVSVKGRRHIVLPDHPSFPGLSHSLFPPKPTECSTNEKVLRPLTIRLAIIHSCNHKPLGFF